VSSAIERQVYLNTIASESNLGTKEVHDDFNAYVAESQREVSAEAPVSSAAKSSLTHTERLLGLVELFPIDPVLAQKKLLDEFSFEGSLLTVTPLSDERKELVLALVEREYATVPEENIEGIIQDLSRIIVTQFLEQLRFEYSMKMNEAKVQKDEEKELQYLALLQKLHQHRHGT
jgi:hypothetical protein